MKYDFRLHIILLFICTRHRVLHAVMQPEAWHFHERVTHLQYAGMAYYTKTALGSFKFFASTHELNLF